MSRPNSNGSGWGCPARQSYQIPTGDGKNAGRGDRRLPKVIADHADTYLFRFTTLPYKPIREIEDLINNTQINRA